MIAASVYCRLSLRCVVPLLLASIFFLGCEGEKETFEATGTVTYMGKPLSGGIVALTPERGRPLNPVRIDSNGGYHIEAPPGNYSVAVVSLPSMSDQGDGKPADELSGPVRSLIPQRYSNPATSGLSVIIKEDGPNIFDFPLR